MMPRVDPRITTGLTWPIWSILVFNQKSARRPSI